jgi:hypothetical protein
MPYSKPELEELPKETYRKLRSMQRAQELQKYRAPNFLVEMEKLAFEEEEGNF